MGRAINHGKASDASSLSSAPKYKVNGPYLIDSDWSVQAAAMCHWDIRALAFSQLQSRPHHEDALHVYG